MKQQLLLPMPKLILLLLFLFLHSPFCYCNSHDISTDTETLLYFKFMHIQSDPQGALLKWNTSFEVCTWQYIACDANRTRVASINLQGLGLAGTIPPHLSNLSYLSNLTLSHNFFQGSIPHQLGHLSRLRSLVLTNNSLQGSIPPTLTQCSNLQRIQLEYNDLSGEIPPQLGSLAQLRVFSVAANLLTGSIPQSFGNLTLLTHLYLNRNSLSGEIPKALGNLQNLLHLQLTENQFEGEIPSSIFNISSLVFLSATSNFLGGELPPNLGSTLVNLEALYLANNSFSGPIPHSLSNLSRIQHLDLGSNAFVGKLPLLGRMHQLERVNLADNNFSSTTEDNVDVFISLMSCTKLKIFSIAHNQLGGDLPSATANLSANLVEFCVDANFFTGQFPQGMSRYRNLTVLALHQNRFMGSIPHTIGLLPKLQRFHIDDNFFFRGIPDVFSNLTLLYQFTLSGNQLSGGIPKSLGKIQRLAVLDLSRNQLSGHIPEEIFEISDSLHYFSLAHNSLTGSLPNDVEKLKMVEAIDVSDNKLSGGIPVSLQVCLNLKSLKMAMNEFEGLIPEKIGEITALEELDLSSNRLSGQIPMSLGKLQSLKNFNLSFNDLRGQVPSKGAFLQLSWESLEGNNQLCVNGNQESINLRLAKCSTIKASNKTSSLVLKIAIPIASFALLLCVALCLFYVAVYCRKKHSAGDQGLSLNSFRGKHIQISYGEILSATNSFDPMNFIGKGGFGSVYRGVINHKKEESRAEQGHSLVVAIKVIDLKQSKASMSFEVECETLRNIRHRNLVKVITSCSSIDHSGGEFKALVLEYMSNESLEKWLYSTTNTCLNLSLIQRLNIAIDVATAMDYLHNDCKPSIAHCDLKPSNVLLDNEMTAHVADFGLARLLSQNPTEHPSNTIGVKGSFGYIAPEYGLGSKATTKGDVYSYGIMLLEMFTGKRPTDDMFTDGLNLNKFAAAAYENRILQIVDPRILQDNCESSGSNTTNNSSSSFSFGAIHPMETSKESSWEYRKERCLEAIIRVGLSCAAELPKDRANMRGALRKLHWIKEALLGMK